MKDLDYKSFKSELLKKFLSKEIVFSVDYDSVINEYNFFCCSLDGFFKREIDGFFLIDFLNDLKEVVEVFGEVEEK